MRKLKGMQADGGLGDLDLESLLGGGGGGMPQIPGMGGVGGMAGAGTGPGGGKQMNKKVPKRKKKKR
jgi:hypothetical protein